MCPAWGNIGTVRSKDRIGAKIDQQRMHPHLLANKFSKDRCRLSQKSNKRQDASDEKKIKLTLISSHLKEATEEWKVEKEALK